MPRARRSETYPCPGTIDEILALLGRIMALKEVEHISLNDGEPIYVERIADMANPGGLDDPSFSDFTLEDMLARIPMEEYVPPRPDLSPSAQLFEMFMLVGAGDYVVTHVLCANKRALRRWIGMEGVLEDNYRMVNAAVVEVSMFPPDVVVVFGAHRAGAPASEVKIALKLTLTQVAVTAMQEPASDVYSPFPPKEMDRGRQDEDRGHAGAPQGDPAEHLGASGADGAPSGGDDAPAWFGPAG